VGACGGMWYMWYMWGNADLTSFRSAWLISRELLPAGLHDCSQRLQQWVSGELKAATPAAACGHFRHAGSMLPARPTDLLRLLAGIRRGVQARPLVQRVWLWYDMQQVEHVACSSSEAVPQ
jgi:hypothetical protein